MNGGRAVRLREILRLKYASNHMTGLNLRLYRDMDLDIGHYRVHGRNGLHVSRVCYGPWLESRINLTAGHQPLVVNITGIPLRYISRRSHTHFGRVSEFAPPSIQNVLSYTSGWLAALGTHTFDNVTNARRTRS